MISTAAGRPLSTGQTASRSLKVALAAVVTAASLLTPSGAFAQARPGAAPARAASPAVATPAAQRAVGLDSLSDEVVMNELAGRGIKSLLNRLFDERKVPAADREAFAALQALRELGGTAPLSNPRRIALLQQSVDGLTNLLPKLNDPTVLRDYAATLIARGIEPDIDTLDYWGDNPATQARVRPAAKVAVEMLKKVSELAKANAAILENQIKVADDPKALEWERLDQLKNQATYVAALSSYYEVVSIDVSGPNSKAGWEERKKIADEAIKYLSEFDNPDSGVGPLVKMRIAKLCMAKGDYANAAKHFQQIIDQKMTVEKQEVAMEPPPTEFQQNDARYFLAVTSILAKKPDEAEKTAGELEKWQMTAIKQDPAVLKTLAAQMSMLKYRIASAKAELAPAGPTKDKANQAADAILTKLGEDFPQFQTLITELLVTRLPDNADLKKQGIPVLQALLTRGNVERNKPEKQPVDQKILNRGLEAAREMASRKTGPGAASPEAVENAALLVPLFLQKQDKLVEAATEFLNYGTNPLYISKPNAALAVDQAAYIAVTQYQKNAADPQVKSLYGRAIEVAAGAPFNRREAFYPRAQWLRTMGDPAKAIEFYKKIPAGDRLEFDARYFEMVCRNTLLEQTKDATLRNQYMREISALINELRPLAQGAINARANDPAAVGQTKFRLGIITMTGADLALQQNQPKRAIELLKGFEDSVKGLPNEAALKNKAIFIRATALINDGQVDQAIAAVQQLAGNKETAQFAIVMVGQLLERLTKDFDVAKQAGDRETMAKNMANKAKLTVFLVPWSANHPDPKIKADAAKFELYNANTKREAGQLLDNPVEKMKVLDEALAAYTQLKQKLPNDPSVDVGMALTQFEKGDFASSSSGFAMLIRDGKLGGPVTVVQGPEGAVVTDNPLYWEVNYKWIKSNLGLASNPDQKDAAKIKDGSQRAIKDLFITHREKTGGDSWSTEFLAMRKEVLPDWAPAAAPATAPATAPAGAPAAASAGQ